MKKDTLPAHIRQLVDKKNYVIAIKTHAQEQSISLEEAKIQIDAYEQQHMAENNRIGKLEENLNKNVEVADPQQTKTLQTSEQGFGKLTQGLDSHLQQQHIKLPLLPRWAKRISVILVIMGIIIWLFYRLFK